MPKRLVPLLLALLLAVPVWGQAGEPWARLRIGMTPAEAAAVLGEPLLRSKGHGFETWTYDHGAEVLIHVAVVGWTAPASAAIAARSHDVWRNRRAGDTAATLHATLRAMPRPAATPAPAPKRRPPAPGTDAYEAYLRG